MLKPILTIFAFLLFITALQAQSPVEDTSTIYTFVEQNPVFPGGDNEVMNFMRRNVKYPAEERDKRKEGKVLVRFVVDTNGAVGDVRVVKKLSPGLDKEAIRAVKRLPPFIPGHQGGKPVRVYLTVPVEFKL